MILTICYFLKVLLILIVLKMYVCMYVCVCVCVCMYVCVYKVHPITGHEGPEVE